METTLDREKNVTDKDKDLEIYLHWRKSPIKFIKDVWNLIPERDNKKFEKGKHITWHQHDILLAVEDAINNKKQRRITIRKGHGIGGSTVESWLILWYLFCFKESKVACTAPTSEQMYDVLWSELAKWLKRMPQQLQDKFEWSASHLRIKESAETWFARARTARKEAPEALAGIHGDYVMFIVDEASGVPEEIYNVAEGALTNKNILVILTSNPTRLTGYFYQTFNKDKANWQQLTFNSIDSPIVEHDYVERIIAKHGLDSDEYRIRVLGEFPREEAMDEQGYLPLYSKEDIKIRPDEGGFGLNKRLGIDPSGEGNDDTAWVLRDNFKTKVIAREKISTPRSIAEKTVTLAKHYNVTEDNITVDNFGIGANVAQELADAGWFVNAVNVGEVPDDDEVYINKRAEAAMRSKEWIRNGGEFVRDEKKGWEEFEFIRYKRTLKGRIQIMPKIDIKKNFGKSPNIWDAFMMTFVKPKQRIKNNELSDSEVTELTSVY